MQLLHGPFLSIAEIGIEYRQDLHKRLKAAEEHQEANASEVEQFQILEEYAATIEGALNLESITPFQYGGLAMQEALSNIQTSIDGLAKKGGRNHSLPTTPGALGNHCAVRGRVPGGFRTRPKDVCLGPGS